MKSLQILISIILLVGLLFLSSLVSFAQVNEEQYKKALVGSLEERWGLIVDQAKKEGKVDFTMWGGNAVINEWVDTYVAGRMKQLYGITVERTPMAAPDFINKLLAEKQAEVKIGTIDLLWINGENFYTAMKNELLWGPFTYNLPNFLKYCNPNAPDIAYDFGYPTLGYEAPYTRAQLNFTYDSARIKNPPKNLAELTKWIKDHPGRFTYPAPPDFTGSTFVKTIFYHTNKTGGYQAFLGDEFKEKLLKDSWGPTWEWFNEIKPYLWRKGETYPASKSLLNTMFAQGEVDFTMANGPSNTAVMITRGKFPPTARPMVLEEGTIGNANFTAIASNAPHKAAAMVLSNFLISPECQINQADPKIRGDLLGIEYSKLSAEDKAKYNRIEFGPACLSEDFLSSRRLPEIGSKYLFAIEEAWTKYVLKK